MTKKALIITSIASDQNPVLKNYAKECAERGIDFIVIGDTKSPPLFNMKGCNFWNVESQKALLFDLTKLAPEKHYSRKNIGYLIAIQKGCDQIQETDDDNMPMAEFFIEKSPEVTASVFTNEGWVNVYNYFTNDFIWARGYPLDELHKKQPKHNRKSSSYCPIQQGLANGNPDVDAVYRLTRELPFNFEFINKLALGENTWSPFNSQNTVWFKEAFPLLYLPSYCSFRMTDIWRSYVAQRIAWECGWKILYHEPTVTQERNDHNLMADFKDEISGYVNNKDICQELQALTLKPGKEYIFENMVTCYQKLIDMRVVEKEEMTLLNAWINDLKRIVQETKRTEYSEPTNY